MKDENEYPLGLVIDLCTRSFLLLGDKGSERMLECDTIDEFMSVLQFATSSLEPYQIQYADIATCSK